MGQLTEKENCGSVITKIYTGLSDLTRDYDKLKTDPKALELTKSVAEIIRNGNCSPQLFQSIQNNLNFIEANYPHIKENKRFKTIKDQFLYFQQNCMNK